MKKIKKDLSLMSTMSLYDYLNKTYGFKEILKGIDSELLKLKLLKGFLKKKGW